MFGWGRVGWANCFILEYPLLVFLSSIHWCILYSYGGLLQGFQSLPWVKPPFFHHSPLKSNKNPVLYCSLTRFQATHIYVHLKSEKNKKCSLMSIRNKQLFTKIRYTVFLFDANNTHPQIWTALYFKTNVALKETKILYYRHIINWKSQWPRQSKVSGLCT